MKTAITIMVGRLVRADIVKERQQDKTIGLKDYSMKNNLTDNFDMINPVHLKPNKSVQDQVRLYSGCIES